MDNKETFVKYREKGFCVVKCVVLFAVSTVTKGKQMGPVLNACGVHCAVYGNHDFGNIILYFRKCSLTLVLKNV